MVVASFRSHRKIKTRIFLVVIVLFCVSLILPALMRSAEGGSGRHDNYLFREWCEETFENGNHIYNAYKEIAFNIKYTSEAAGSDFWQTPIETLQSKKGDCEDVIFLFFSRLSPSQENAEIVWGWVINKRTGVATAHVWYQLADREGQQYIVDGFSNDWDGIIPMKIVESIETRKPILTMSHLEASRLAGLVSKPDSREMYQSIAGDAYARQRIAVILNKEISKIFGKLHEMFARYERQKRADSQFVDQGTMCKR